VRRARLSRSRNSASAWIKTLASLAQWESTRLSVCRGGEMYVPWAWPTSLWNS